MDGLNKGRYAITYFLIDRTFLQCQGSFSRRDLNKSSMISFLSSFKKKPAYPIKTFISYSFSLFKVVTESAAAAAAATDSRPGAIKQLFRNTQMKMEGKMPRGNLHN